MGHTILIAEDDPSIQKLFFIVLRKEGYEIEISPDGRFIYENHTPLPSLFILDNQLTEHNGLDVCRYLKSKEDTRHIPVIIVSATPGIGTLAKEAGADDYLEKPFSISVLLDKIKKYVKSAVPINV
jgi:DNA-binding response OmpR family regulator